MATTPATTSSSTEGFLASGRHPVNIGHLVMGVAFAGLMAVWALVAGNVVEGADIRWLLPAPWVLAGLVGLVALITADGRRYRRTAVGWVAGPAAPRGEESEEASSTMEE